MPLKELFTYWSYKVFAPGTLLRRKYEAFKELLVHDRTCLEYIARIEEIYYGKHPVDWSQVRRLVHDLEVSVDKLVASLVDMNPAAYVDLPEYVRKIRFYLDMTVQLPEFDFSPPYTVSPDGGLAFGEELGGKAKNLFHLAKETDFHVPEGFVVTAGAFHYFLEYNELREKIDSVLAKARTEDPAFLADICREIQKLIMAGEIPAAVEEELRDRIAGIASVYGGRVRFAVRSSAVAEDSSVSFAGQYDSVLNVSISDIGQAYKKVIAGKYNARAVGYRIRCGLDDVETPMAVLVMAMIDAECGGVMYTLDPGTQEADKLIVYCAEGAVRYVVDGSASPEIISVDRDNPRKFTRTSGGQAPQVVSGTDVESPRSLKAETIEKLAGWGLALEELFAAPQDVEWCLDAGGELYVLQSRNITSLKEELPDQDAVGGKEDTPAPPEPENEIAVKGGKTASPGVGIGTVAVPERISMLENIPEGSVLVSETLSPDFVEILDHLEAVVTDTGSKAGHFASIAREFGLPVVVDTKFGTRMLENGETVTVDADRGRVYRGAVPALAERAARDRKRPKTPFMRRLEETVKIVSPLNLVDPGAENFKPAGLKTMHDVIRFCHEKGVAEMFNIVGKDGRGMAESKHLQSDLPLAMRILDLGAALAPETYQAKVIQAEHMVARPLKAVWAGLTHPAVPWQKDLPAFDWEEFDRVSAGIADFKSQLSSYAVAAGEYLHLMIRFGYHFAVVDCHCSDEEDTNYLHLRFKGGGAAMEGRSLRLQYIRRILERRDFKVLITGDMCDARLDRRNAKTILASLKIVGAMLGKTRLMDVALSDREQVEALADEFLEQLAP
jgi:pyruvate,water dikinase